MVIVHGVVVCRVVTHSDDPTKTLPASLSWSASAAEDIPARQAPPRLDRGTRPAHSSAMPRSFTVDEANRMLPLVKRIVSDAVRDYWRWQDAVREFEVAALRSSPDHPDDVAEQLQNEATRLARDIDGYMRELKDLGVMFK